MSEYKLIIVVVVVVESNLDVDVDQRFFSTHGGHSSTKHLIF